MTKENRSIVCEFSEAEYRILRTLINREIMNTPTSEARNHLTEINIKIMLGFERSGL